MNSELYNGPPEMSQYTSKAVEICTLAEKMLDVYFLLNHFEFRIMLFDYVFILICVVFISIHL